MDWYSWLSKSALEPSLVYEYGLAFSRNELQKEDLAYFNHEFLQSMGISVAKHRLEILKHARKDIGESPKSLSKLILAINKTRKCFNKYVTKLVRHENDVIKPQPLRYRDQWSTALTLSRKGKNEKELMKIEQQAVVRTTRKVAKSDPLDYRGQDQKLMVHPRSLKLSGPLDRKMQEKLVFNYRSPIYSGPINHIGIARQERSMMLTNGRKSPRLSGPLNYVRPASPKVHGDHYNKEKASGDYDDQTLWARLFRDMKPT